MFHVRFARASNKLTVGGLSWPQHPWWPHTSLVNKDWPVSTVAKLFLPYYESHSSFVLNGIQGRRSWQPNHFSSVLTWVQSLNRQNYSSILLFFFMEPTMLIDCGMSASLLQTVIWSENIEKGYQTIDAGGPSLTTTCHRQHDRSIIVIDKAAGIRDQVSIAFSVAKFWLSMF